MADNQHETREREHETREHDQDGGKSAGGQDGGNAGAKEAEQRHERARRRARPWVRLGMVAVLLVLIAGGVWYWLSTKDLESTDDAYTDGRAIAISSHVTGTVFSLDVNDNQFVHAGDPLIHIDPRDYQAALEQARGQLAAAQGQLAATQQAYAIGRVNFPARLEQAKAQLLDAQANLFKAQTDYRRQQSLPRAATTGQQIDYATAALRSAEAQVASAQAAVLEATPVQPNIQQVGAQVRQLGGSLDQARGAVAQAELNLYWCIVRAPQDGWITKRNVEQGNYVQQGTQIFNIVSPDVWITANFKETQLNRMHPGQHVKIAVDAYPRLKLEGHLDSVQLGSGSKFTAFPPENATGNFVKIVQRVPVKIVIDSGLDPNLPLPLGISVEPTVALEMSGAVGAGWRPKANPWLIAVVVTVAAFMEVLDTTIVNVSLPHIAGSLSSSYDDATWALTSYLVANGIVLTISGWLSDVFGRKRYFLICIGMFTVFSFLCGTSTSLPELIIFRLAQGFFGGGLQPNQQSIILDTFEPAQRGRAMAVVAIATIVAPILGPTLGGYITDNFSWRWVFFINIPVGLLGLFGVGTLVEDPPWVRERRSKGVDYIGIALITLGLGCLQVALDRGEDDDWLGSSFIRVMFLFAVLGILGAIGWLVTAKRPVVSLRPLADRNFAVGVTMIAGMAFILYSSAVVIPQFAQQVIGYTATLAGLILSPGGAVVILLIPIVTRLLGIMPTRYLITVGFLVMGMSLVYSSRITPDMDFLHLALLRASQTAGLAFMFVPISTIAYSSLPRELNGDAAALYTMFRNVFGSIGISTATSLVTQRTQIQQSYLAQWMTPLNPAYAQLQQQTQQAIVNMGHTPAAAAQIATGQIYQTFREQASVLAYSDVFQICAYGAFALVPLTFLFSNYRPSGGQAAPAGH